MRKRWLVLFIILSAFAIVVSTEIDLQHILAGMLLGLLGVWFGRIWVGDYPISCILKSCYYWADALYS